MRNELLDERNFITPAEFAEILDNKISVTTINVLIRKGQIPSVKMGRKNLIPVVFAREQLNKGLPN